MNLTKAASHTLLLAYYISTHLKTHTVSLCTSLISSVWASEASPVLFELASKSERQWITLPVGPVLTQLSMAGLIGDFELMDVQKDNGGNMYRDVTLTLTPEGLEEGAKLAALV